MLKPSDNIIAIEVSPDNNRNLLQYSVLRIRVRLRRRQLQDGPACRVVIRSNLNQAPSIRQQIIDLVEKQQSYSTDFYDIVARYDANSDAYCLDVLLSQAGYFEFKARVESTDRDFPWVKWADGPNTGVSVTPLEYGRNNSIYCAFIRQFISNYKDNASAKAPQMEPAIVELEKQGACVIPPSGNFEKFKQYLPFIIQELGMKIIHLLPINPVPVAYGRMGMYGSPYATTDYFGIDHSYGTFSRYKTIEEQFVDLTSTIHGLGAKVFLDMVINHTGWASSLLFTHRKWFKTQPDQKLVSPGAWGIIWGDLVELDYRHKDLWKYMAEVFLAWCGRGIDGFRLDAGYMIPLHVWQYIISKVRKEFPDTMFLLEGLGGPWATTEKLLTHGQNNWAYSELFQNYTRQEITDYLTYAKKVSSGKGVLVHYAETHDNDRLAKKGKVYTSMRLHLCALTSFAGAWGFTNGVEWLATERIDVHRNADLNWGSSENLVKEIARINTIIAENPAFWHIDNLEIIQPDSFSKQELLVFVRSNPDQTNVILCIINLDAEKPSHIDFRFDREPLAGLISDGTVLRNLFEDSCQGMPKDRKLSLDLAAGQSLAYRLEKAGQAYQATIPALFDTDHDKIALIYRILLNRFAPHEAGQIDQEKLLRQVNDYRKFIALVNTVRPEHLIDHDISADLDKIDDYLVKRYSEVWTFSQSSKEFIISGDKWLVVQTYIPCTAYLETDSGTISMDSIATDKELTHLSFFPPQPENKHFRLSFNWKIKQNLMTQRHRQEEFCNILSVPSGRRKVQNRKLLPLKLDKQQLHKDYATVLLTNCRGSQCQIPALPGKINSKYDAIFIKTIDPNNPAEKLALVKTVMETVQVGQKYFDLDESFLVSFTRYPYPTWEFVYDDGQYYVQLERSLIMSRDEDSLFVRYRLRQGNTAIKLTSKFCLEHRNIHELPRAIDNDDLRRHMSDSYKKLGSTGIKFTPGADISVIIAAKKGAFLEQPHWIYHVDFAKDAEDGLAHTGDLFAPGVFDFKLDSSESAVVVVTTDVDQYEQAKISFQGAEITHHKHTRDLLSKLPSASARKDSYVRMLIWALDQFLLRPGKTWMMMAGYPWLGMNVRDSLTCVRAILTAERDEAARDIILVTAATERQGLLADWVDGHTKYYNNAESALRLFEAARGYVKHTGEDDFWDCAVDAQRTLRQVLINIYENLKTNQSPEKVHLNADSGMIYCPAGFTWMNTNHPQATPRRGYPVEIQALWYKILPVIAKIAPDYASEVEQLRRMIEKTFMVLYWNQKRGILADNLITLRKDSVADTVADTSLRFNQLAAIHAGLVPSEQGRRIVDKIAKRLVIPAAVRSLAEEAVQIPLQVVDDDGKPLLDPRMPYQGYCSGNEKARRLAYHNGTAWPFAYPGFIEAQAVVFHFSDRAVKQALAYFEPLWSDLCSAGIGSISEMKDGNYPHKTRGCHAYALSVAETLRVYMRLKYPHHAGKANSIAAQNHGKQTIP